MDPWSALGSQFLSGDVNYGMLVAAKKALTLLGNNKDLLVKLCIACADNDVFDVKAVASEDSSVLNKIDSQGFTPLIYAICFDQKECVDILLSLAADADKEDTKLGWTPIMWATYFEHKDIVESLLGGGADPLKIPGKGKQNAVDLAKPGSAIYEYFKAHDYIGKPKAVDESAGNDFYKKDMILPSTEEDDQAFQAQLKLQTMSIEDGGGASSVLDVKDREKSPGSARFVDDSASSIEASLVWDDFDFNTVLPKQGMAVTDDSFPATVDYVFSLFKKYPSRPIYPATVVFMCLRYADNKLQSPETVEAIIDFFMTRVRTETGTKSGVVQLAASKKDRNARDAPSSSSPDIVCIGFWIGCLNHLIYFMHRDVCGFFRRYPRIFQTICATLQPLVAQLAFALDSRLEDMIEPCLLDYASVPDMDTVYRRNWNLFGRHKPVKKTTYEEILDMLYPPSLEEQRKPSPLKIIQTFGALLYVLELYHINDEIKQQCFSYVIYWLGSSVFNRVVANRKYASRAVALQIRLNLSYVQDWLRTNDLIPVKTGDVDFKNHKYPDDVVIEATGVSIKGVARFRDDPTDPRDATFYFNSLFKIGKLVFAPTLQLLEWLQVMTGIHSVETLRDTLHNFSCLDSVQVLQSVKNYNYEVEEVKFRKELSKWLKTHPFEAKRKKGMYYISEKDKVFFNVGQAFPLALPGYLQLLHQYGVDLDGVDERKMRRYQPNLPVEVQDDLDNILDKYDSTNRKESEAVEGETLEDVDSSAEIASKSFNEQSQKNDLFKSLAVPGTIAHKTWATGGDEAENPWS
ncbi:DEKNAAC102230 [Brettanomyces naardenensis]|uniref:DEKNAAC102230 n=1 Tax=Brettanomyces naardenensis TaxID=13370 RepID=A0A448YKW5_BRENA|nr:DEKNAAC102230 [Brettanomyces naardenensis]